MEGAGSKFTLCSANRDKSFSQITQRQHLLTKHGPAGLFSPKEMCSCSSHRALCGPEAALGLQLETEDPGVRQAKDEGEKVRVEPGSTSWNYMESAPLGGGGHFSVSALSFPRKYVLFIFSLQEQGWLSAKSLK